MIYAEGVSTPNALKSDSNFSNAATVMSTATVSVVESFIFPVTSCFCITCAVLTLGLICFQRVMLSNL